MHPAPSPARFLHVCQHIEHRAADFYRLLAAAHKDYPNVSALWTKTAREEDNHALQYNVLMAGSAAIVESCNNDLDAALETLRSVEEVIAQCRQDKPTPLEALRIAILMEEGLQRFHSVNAVNFRQNSYAKLFEAMMNADRAHIKALEDFAASLEDG